MIASSEICAVRKGDHVTEEEGELVYLHSDGRKTRFV
jgi:hypothetical protein